MLLKKRCVNHCLTCIPTSGYTNRTTSSAWCSPLSQAGHTTPSWTGVLAIQSPPHLSPFVHWGAWPTTTVLVTERWLDGSAWWVRFLPVLWYVAAQVLKGSMLAVGILQPRTQQRQFPCVSTVMEPKPSNISKYCLCYRLWAFRKAPCFKFMTLAKFEVYCIYLSACIWPRHIRYTVAALLPKHFQNAELVQDADPRGAGMVIWMSTSPSLQLYLKSCCYFRIHNQMCCSVTLQYAISS